MSDGDHSSGVGFKTFDCQPTGFSGTPTQRDSRYIVLGQLCVVILNVQGTSNATTLTVTLPFAPVGYGSDGLLVTGLRAVNAGGDSTSPGIGQCNSGSTLNLYKDHTFAAWTNSGAKQIAGFFAYQIAA